MFSPCGYISFANFEQWLQAHTRRFLLEKALPWAEQYPFGPNPSGRAYIPFREAQEDRIHLQKWLADICLSEQPVPVFIANPEGKVMRTSPSFFMAVEQLSNGSFNWPPDFHIPQNFWWETPTDEEPSNEFDNSELSAERGLVENRNYYFYDENTTCMAVPSDDALKGLPSEAQATAKVIRPFDGWAVCFAEGDIEKLQSELTAAFSWDE